MYEEKEIDAPNGIMMIGVLFVAQIATVGGVNGGQKSLSTKN